MEYAKIAVARAASSATAATSAGGLKTCTRFSATMMLFEKAATTNPTTLKLGPITGETIPVFNTLERTIASGGDVLVGYGIDKRWVTIESFCQ